MPAVYLSHERHGKVNKERLLLNQKLGGSQQRDQVVGFD